MLDNGRGKLYDGYVTVSRLFYSEDARPNDKA